ncbi:MAG TPA: alpha-E domain-containing protein [Roseomonas sp.]|jgi:uncharacterized alpha-E superfamily protein
MLSRTADSLFWLGRYTERAGNVARGLMVASRMAGLTHRDEEWRSLLVATGGEAGFYEKHGDATRDAVLHYLILDAENSSGLLPSIEAARRNARQVRAALTADMWEAINDTWNEARKMAPLSLTSDGLAPFLDWVKARSLLFYGAAADTMLRDEAWRFTHLGTMLERGDNTARLLDVRHTLLAKQPEAEGSAVDYLQWQAVLRSVSAQRAYQWLYHARLQPHLVAELLILRPELPRSMIACARRVDTTLDLIAGTAGGRRGECHRLAGEQHARLKFGRIEPILAAGLHDFLTECIDRNVELGQQIARFYLTV